MDRRAEIRPIDDVKHDTQIALVHLGAEVSVPDLKTDYVTRASGLVSFANQAVQISSVEEYMRRTRTTIVLFGKPNWFARELLDAEANWNTTILDSTGVKTVTGMSNVDYPHFDPVTTEMIESRWNHGNKRWVRRLAKITEAEFVGKVQKTIK